MLSAQGHANPDWIPPKRLSLCVPQTQFLVLKEFKGKDSEL